MVFFQVPYLSQNANKANFMMYNAMWYDSTVVILATQENSMIQKDGNK